MTTRPSPYSSSSGLAWILGLLAIGLGAAVGFFVVRSASSFQAAAIVFGLILAVFAIVRVEFGLLLLIFITYVRLSDNLITFYNAPSIARPFIAFLFGAVVLRAIWTGSFPKGWLRPTILVGLYGLVIFSSLIYAADFDSALYAFNVYFKDAIIAILVVLLLQRKESSRHAIWTLLFAGIVMGTISVYQYLTSSFTNIFWGFGQANIQNIVGETEGYRISGPVGDPNFYAQILVVLVPLAIDRLFNEKSLLMKGVAAWALAVCALSAIFTFSRGGFVALVIALGAFALYRRPRPLQVLAILAIALVVFSYIPNKYTERLLTIVSLTPGQGDVRTEVSFRGRASELIAAWMMFADHPLLGVGVGNYPVFYQEYSRQIGLDPRIEARAAHNLFLEVAAETGIIGLTIFLLILFNVFNGLLRAWRLFGLAGMPDQANMVAALAFGIIGYLGAALFIHGAYPRYLWLLVGIAFAMPQVAANTLSEPQPEQ